MPGKDVRDVVICIYADIVAGTDYASDVDAAAPHQDFDAQSELM